MNKKLVLSVLSTAVVASMASAAMAKPPGPGFLVGGDVDKYYSLEAFLGDHFDEALDGILENLDDTYYVTPDRNIVGFIDAVYAKTAEDLKAKEVAPTKEHFGDNVYAIVDGEGTYDPSTDTDLPGVPVELKVEGVSAINAKQIEIKFSKAVEESTVVDPADDTLVDGAITVTALGTAPSVDIDDAAAVLSKDGKTLTLTADAAEYFNGEYAVTVTTAVTDEDGEEIVAYSGIVKNVDTVRPTVEKVTYDDNETAVVWFSEPLKDSGSVTLSDAGANAGFTAGDDFITVDLAGAAAATDITVSIVGAKDYNDNLISPNPASVVVKKDISDTVKPTVTDITASSDTVFTVTFSEKLKTNPTISVGGTPLVWGTDATITKDSTGLVYTVTLDTAVTGLKAVAVTSYSDLSNNAGDTFSKVLNFTADVTPPVVTSYKVEKISGVEYLVLTYSEDVTPVPGKTINFTQVVDGVESSSSIATSSTNFTLHNAVNGKSNSVKLDLSTFVNGQYTLSLPVGLVQDLASTPNDSALTTDSVSFTRGSDTDTIAPEVTSVTNGPDNSTVLIDFSEKLDVASANNVNNYSIEGVTITKAVLTSNAATATVKLTLEAGSVTANGDRNLTVQNVKDAANNVIKTVTKTVTLKENVAPTIVSATLTNTDEITLTFSEAIDNVDDDFEVFVGTEATARTLAAGGITNPTSKTVVIKVDTEFTVTDLEKGVVVKPSATIDVEDLNDNLLIFTSQPVSQ